MNKISKKTMIAALIYICLWFIGSIFLFRETNGKVIIIITAVAIIAKINSQINEDRKANSNCETNN